MKLYLFDVFTKLAIAADSAPDDSLQFHVCSDVIDIAVDVGTICWSVYHAYVVPVLADDCMNASQELSLLIFADFIVSAKVNVANCRR